MRILLVEDDVPLGSSLQQALIRAGYDTTWVRRVEDARRFLGAEQFAVALLDIMLPDGSGLELLAWLRGAGHTLPVLMLTARDSVTDRIKGLDGGADDYLAKPFSVEELLSRIRAVTRRLVPHRSAAWQVGPLSIDTVRRRVFGTGGEVALSQREYDILLTLASHPGKVFTRAQIDMATTAVRANESNSIDVHIHNLRRKLGGDLIGTVRGVGYVLEPPA
jgi:DNA-binding response OmpR family regulator